MSVVSVVLAEGRGRRPGEPEKWAVNLDAPAWLMNGFGLLAGFER